MGGIAGSTHISERLPNDVLPRAQKSLLHRGPGQQGQYVSAKVLLVATRLKILDRILSRQPRLRGTGIARRYGRFRARGSPEEQYSHECECAEQGRVQKTDLDDVVFRQPVADRGASGSSNGNNQPVDSDEPRGMAIANSQDDEQDHRESYGSYTFAELVLANVTQDGAKNAGTQHGEPIKCIGLRQL
jgi:hypothetical protein